MNNNLKQSIQLQVNSLKNLPALPEESIKIVEAINNPDISIETLSDTLALSPGLVARLLGLANSAYFGQPRQIKDLHTAIVQVLGLQLVKSLTMSIVLNVQLDSRRCKGFDTKSFWMHSLLTAIGAQKLAALDKSADASMSTIYTSGLLLYIGLLVIAHLFPKEFDQSLAEDQADYLKLGDEISHHLGLSHYQMGYMLLNKWQLPDFYQMILHRFEDVDLNDCEAKHIRILRASQKIACLLLDDDSWSDDSLIRIAESLSLPIDVVSRLVGELAEKTADIQKLAEVMRT